MASPRVGLSKQDIYRAVSSYQSASSDEARDRMFERDKEDLRLAGVMVEVVEFDQFDQTEQARYRIPKSSFEWPKGLKLNPGKMQLLELAAKAWNNQLLEGSAQLGLTRLKSLGLVQRDTDLRPFSPKLLTRHGAFAPLATAISEGLLVSFSYQKPEGQPTTRLVTPLKMRQLEGQWVLLADHEGAIKNFLLRRIISEVEIHEQLAAQVPQELISQAEQDLVDFVSGNVATLEVVADTEAASNFGKPDGGEVSVCFMDEALFAEDLLDFGAEVQVLAPETLKRRVKAGLKAVIASHA